MPKLSFEEARKKELGGDGGNIRRAWETKPGDQKEIDKRIAASAGSGEFEKSRKDQKKHSEWKKGPRGTAEKA